MAKVKTAKPATGPKQVIENTTAQRMADTINLHKVGAGAMGKAIIDISSASVSAAYAAALVLGMEDESRKQFFKVLGMCLRVVADQLDCPFVGEFDPLRIKFFHESSSNVAHSAYDPNKLILEVYFKSGGLYHYFDVPRQVRDQMMASESIGAFLAKVIKPAYRAEKIG